MHSAWGDNLSKRWSGKDVGKQERMVMKCCLNVLMATSANLWQWQHRETNSYLLLFQQDTLLLLILWYPTDALDLNSLAFQTGDELKVCSLHLSICFAFYWLNLNAIAINFYHDHDVFATSFGLDKEMAGLVKIDGIFEFIYFDVYILLSSAFGE